MTEQAYHLPVMVRESLEGLAIRPQGVYVDGTLGGGGHFAHIARALAHEGTVLGIDRDPEAIAFVEKNPPPCAGSTVLVQSTFSRVDEILARQGYADVDGILLDLGVSSRQIDTPERGFSYSTEAPLDMRMNRQEGMTVEQLLAEIDEAHLAAILAEGGEIRNPARMAAAVACWRVERSLATSSDLKVCLEKEYGAPLKYKMLSKVFQALRIATNNELGELRDCLDRAVGILKSGGRLVVIAYHSIEDRIVKNFMRDLSRSCVCPPRVPCTCGHVQSLRRITTKALKPTPDEVARNRRARSARLRVAEKI